MSDNSYTSKLRYDKQYSLPKSYTSGGNVIETVEMINQLESGPIAKRHIRKDTMETFGVKIKYSEEDGPMGGPVAAYFPYYENGVVVGYKRKKLVGSKKDKDHFTVVGRVGVDSELFGMNTVRKSAKRLYISEGELDTLSLYQSLMDSIKGTAYEAYTPAVVSISCGAPNAKMSVANNLDFVKSFKEIVICFDNDCRTSSDGPKVIKGLEATEEVGSLFDTDNIYTLPLPTYVNDINDMLTKGYTEILVQKAKFELKKYRPERIISCSEISLESLIKPKEKGIYISSFPLLMEKLWGLRKGELNVYTSLSGKGKSLSTSIIAYELAVAKQKVGMVFLEETYEQTVKRMVANYCNVNYNLFKFSPTKYATKEQIGDALDWAKDKFYFYKEGFNTSKFKYLMSTINYLVNVVKVDYIVIDHLGMLLTDSDIDDERRFIDSVLTELAGFVSKNPVGIQLVSHLNRKAQDEIGRIADIKEPKWISVRQEHLRGSGALEQLAWSVIGLDFEFLPSKQRGKVRWCVLKNREIGILGNADVFKVDDQTGKVNLYTDDDY